MLHKLALNPPVAGRDSAVKGKTRWRNGLVTYKGREAV